MSNELRKLLDLSPEEKQENERKEFDDDFEFVRQNLFELVNKSSDAIEDLIDIARKSQQPRAFEVLNSFIKNSSDLSKDLLDIRKKKKDIEEEKYIGPDNIHNNLVVGTTADLAKMLEDANKKKEENNE